MLAVRLDNPLETKIALLAKHRHTTRSHIVREAIIRFLEDCEDIELAMIAQQKTKSTKSLSKIRKSLGLDGKGQRSR